MKKTLIAIGFLALIIGVLLIVLPNIYVPKEITREFHVPSLLILHTESLNVPQSTFITRSIYLDAGDDLDIEIGVTSEGNTGIGFSVNDGSQTYFSVSNATSVNREWIVPLSRNYTFVYDNKVDLITSKDVEVTVWNRLISTQYGKVTENTRLVPFEVAYAGTALVLIGVSLSIVAIAKKDKPTSPEGIENKSRKLKLTLSGKVI